MKKNILLIFTIAALQISFAQQAEKCANTLKHKEYLKANPEAKTTFNQIENQLQKIIQKGYTKRSTNQIYLVPLVIHVMHLGEEVGVGSNISDAQIVSGITQLNNAFRNVSGQGIDTEIEFVLAKRDPDCNASNGIVRFDASGIAGYASDGVLSDSLGADEVTLKASSKWPNDSYYNIWIVSEIEGNDGGFGTQGFAYFPGTSSNRDGTVILNTAWGNTGTANSWNNQGKTGIHELGHGLNLHHTFKLQSASDTTFNGCPPNIDCTAQGDFCCDTDPHKVSSSFTCTDSQINECTGNIYGDVVHNYMDYSDQDCQYMFSQDQIDRMRATLEGTRSGLIVSKGKVAVLKSFTQPLGPLCEPTSQATGLSGGYAGIMNVRFHNLVAKSSNTQNDGGYLNNASECLNTVYVHPDSSYDLSITPWTNTSKAKGWIDYNNDGYFTNDELIYDKTLAAYTTVSESLTIPTNAVEGEFLRMRVLLDLSDISNACMNPLHGQAEDYAVYIYKIHTVSGKIYEDISGACGTTGGALLAVGLVKNGQTHYTTITDGFGNYTFTSVASGTYELHVDSSSYDNVTAPDIIVIADVLNEEYIHELTSINICDNITNISRSEAIIDISITPNPVINNFVVKFSSESSEPILYQLTDIQGKVIERGNIATANMVTKVFNIEKLNSGVYILSLGNQNGTKVCQVIKR
jgi:hypothetical protein